eukprot:8331981-Alexandrium_andersonii.AAC.1
MTPPESRSTTPTTIVAQAAQAWTAFQAGARRWPDSPTGVQRSSLTQTTGVMSHRTLCIRTPENGSERRNSRRGGRSLRPGRRVPGCLVGLDGRETLRGRAFCALSAICCNTRWRK